MKGRAFDSLLAILVIIAVGLTIYSNVFHGEFISDDYIFVVDNHAVRDITNISGIWHSFNTRFLVILSFAFNFWLGGLDTFGYHIFNIIIHLINAFLVYRFIRLTFETPALVNDPFKQHKASIAFYASLVFLCHPIQTQGVAFITQRAVSMACLFYLLTLIFYITARLRARPVYWVGAFVSMLLGLFSKEMTITIPAMLVVCEIFFFDSIRENTWRKVKVLLPFFLLAGLLPCVFLQDQSGSVVQLKDQVSLGSFNWNYFLAEINVLRTYLRLLFLPINQNHIYDYPIAAGFWGAGTLFSLCLLAFVFSFVVTQFKTRRLLSFSILWFFITTSVEVVVVSFVNRGVIFEHWLYLPMVGFSLFLSFILHQALRDIRVFKRVMTGIIVLLSILTYQRNHVWQNEIVFWRDVIKKSPQKPEAYFGAGAAYQRKEMYEEAYAAYQESLRLCEEKKLPTIKPLPLLSRTHSNLGVLYFIASRDAEAETSFKRALELNPRNAKAYNNSGVFYFKTGRYEDAVKTLKKSLELQGDYPDGYFYLGQSYAALGKDQIAQEYFKKAKNLFKMYRDQAKVKEVENSLRLIYNGHQ